MFPRKKFLEGLGLDQIKPMKSSTQNDFIMFLKRGMLRHYVKWYIKKESILLCNDGFCEKNLERKEYSFEGKQPALKNGF